MQSSNGTNVKERINIEKSPYVNYVDKNGNTILCRVLYDSSSQYGIEIISENSVETVTIGSEDTNVSASDFSYSGPNSLNDLSKKACASFNRYITTLNERANSYLDKNGIAEKARCVGSNPSSPEDTDEYFTTTYPFMINRGWNNVFKKSDSNSNTDESQMRNLGILTKSFVYWLASRNVSDDMRTPTDNQGGIEFNTKKVGSGKDLYFTIWYSGGTGMLSFDSINASNGLRPVFHLSENTMVVSGNGTKDKPYNLGLQ